MLPTARIRLLGRLELRLGGAELAPLDSARAESLLAYLLLHRDEPQARRRVAFVLWPESTEAQARTNLRHVLHTLRRWLPEADGYLESSPATLRWRPETTDWLDVAVFEDLLDRADQRPEALREAVAIYTGDLLEGCSDEWLLEERDRLRHRLLDALAELAELCEAAGDVDEATSHAERLLRADPLRERTYRQLMRLHSASGDRARALRVYHACSSTLERELGVEPSASTRAVYEALLPEEPDIAVAPAARVAGPPLVGRNRERESLAALWRSAEAGRAQLVLISGEAGTGKTRLVEELLAWCARRGAVTAQARCYAAEGPLAYAPVAAWLRGEAWWPRLARLAPARLTELARLVPELLVETPGLPRPEPLPEDDRRPLFDAVSAAVLAVGAPLLLVVDDLQHADRPTCQLLHFLLRSHPRARVLVAATARSEDSDRDAPLQELLTGLQALERVTEVELTPLSRNDTAALAERLTGAPFAAAQLQRLWDETAGNPLFVVEALRAGWPGGGLSPKVQAVISERLAQLSAPARDLVGVAAAVGTDFTPDLLAAASDADQDAVVRSLDELWRRRIVREQGGAAYDFGHDKVRAVAYAETGPVRLRHHHLRIAGALERVHAGDLDAVSARIAWHYETAGATGEAITWLARAAEASQRVHDPPEAVRRLEHALDALASLPATADRDARELALLTALPAPLVAVEGYASGRLSAVQERALVLADLLRAEPEPPLLRSLALASLTLGDFPKAQRFAEQLRVRGEQEADDVLVVEGACALGFSAFWQADFDAARHHLEEVVDRYRPEHRRTHLLRFGQDPQVVALARLGNTLWFLGQPAAASAARDAALASADEAGHPFSRAAALVFTALLALDMGEDARVRANAAALATLQQAPQIRLAADALAGYVDVLDDSAGAGLSRIRRAMAEAGRAQPAPGTQAIVGRVLLAACAVVGDAPAGLAEADRYLALGGAARVWEGQARQLRASLTSPTVRR